MSNKGQCKLTLKDGQFVKAHIIPAAFYRISKEGSHGPFKVLNSKNAGTKRNWQGFYDGSLVTETGEKLFDELDNYAIRLLRPRPKRADYVRDGSGFIAQDDGKKLGYTISKYSYDLLRRFFDSLLWRISASETELMARIKYSREEDLRTYILQQKPTPENFYKICVIRHFDKWGKLIFPPHNTSDHNGIRMTCGGFTFIFDFLDIEKDALKDAFLTEGKPFLILTWDLGKTEYLEYAKEMMVKSIQSRKF